MSVPRYRGGYVPKGIGDKGSRGVVGEGVVSRCEVEAVVSGNRGRRLT